MTTTDSFNRANNASSLGNADTGETWTYPSGTWGISSNKAYESAGTSQAIAVLDVGYADIDMSCVLTFPSGGTTGLCFRVADNSNYLLISVGSGGDATIYKKQAGSFTALTASSGVGGSSPFTFRIVANGSSITIYRNGVSVLTHTLSAGDQTSYGSKTKHGLRCDSTSTARFDDLSIAAPNVTVAGSKATETDTGNSGGVVLPGTRATETDTGNAGTAVLPTVGLGAKASETDIGRGGAPVVVIPGARATETDVGHHGAVHMSGVIPPPPPGSTPTGGMPGSPGASQEIEPTFSIRALDDLTTELATVTPTRFDWDDDENVAGSCTIAVQDDDPNIAQLVADRAVVVSLNGVEAFTVVLDQLVDDVVHPDEEHDQLTTGTGRMLRSILDRARAGPTRGYKQKPWSDARTFSCGAREYSPGPDWVNAIELAAQNGVTTRYGGLPTSWFDPTAKWICPPGCTDNAAPVGIWWAIGDFTLAQDMAVVLIFAADNTASVFVDGLQVSEIGDGASVSGFSNTTRVPLFLTAGNHRIMARVANYPFGGFTEPPFGAGAVLAGNPTAFLCACFEVDNRGALGDLIIHTDYQWSVLNFPSSPPGMSVRQICRHIVEENVAEAPDVLAGVAITGTDFEDENGLPWPIYEFVTVDVSRSLLELLDEWSGMYCDWDVPGPTNKTLHLWNWHTRGLASGVNYATTGSASTTGLGALRRTDLPVIADALQVRWAGGWLRRPETGGTKVGVIKPAKAASVDEANRVADQLLALYGRTRRMWAGAFIPTSVGDVPYLDFGLGDTHGLAGHVERTIGIGGTLTDNGIVFRSKSLDPVQSAEQRVLATLTRMAEGTMGGVAPASPAGPTPKFGVDTGAAQQTFSPPDPLVPGVATKIDVFPFSGNLLGVMLTLAAPGWTDTAAQFLVDFGVGFLDVLGGAGIIPAGVKVVFIPVSFLGRSTVFITGGEGGDILSVNITSVGILAAGMTLKPVWV